MTEHHIIDPYGGPVGKRIKRFLESSPPLWWNRFVPWIFLAGLCWWFGVGNVIGFVLASIIVAAFACVPFALVHIMTNGR